MLAYAEYLQSDPGLWRITIDYMYSCGAIGRAMADEVLVRVPLRLQQPPAEGDAAAKEEAARIRSGQLAGVLESVSKACFEYKREEVRRTVCRVRPPLALAICSYVLMFASDRRADVRRRKGVRPRRVLLRVGRGLAGPRTRRGPRA